MSLTVALDTSTSLTCAGLDSSDGRRLEVFDVPRKGERPNHATVALSLLAGLLAEVGVTWSAVDRVVVGVGPGSFTGLRVGIATALGIGRGASADTVGISGLAALSSAAGTPADVCSLIDARRGEVFALLPGSLEPLCVTSDVSQLKIAEGTTCVGDGAQLLRESLVEVGMTVPADDSSLHRISPLALIDLADSGHSLDPSLPLYVRGADAVPSAQRVQK